MIIDMAQTNAAQLLLLTLLVGGSTASTARSAPLVKRQNLNRSNNYSGASISASQDGTSFNYITAQIYLPASDYITTESSPPAIQKAAMWVGFGGAIPDSNGILQTGCSVYNDGMGDQYAKCWYEFFPAPPVFFDDFVPSVGDNVQLELSRTSDTTGHATLTNLSTGDVKDVDISAPDGHSCNGQDADWILENPQARSTLPNFHTSFFEGCAATTDGGNTYGPGASDIVWNEYKDLGDGAGRTQWTNSFVPSESEVQIDFVANYS